MSLTESSEQPHTCYYLVVKDPNNDKTEAERGERTCSGSHNRSVKDFGASWHPAGPPSHPTEPTLLPPHAPDGIL